MASAAPAPVRHSGVERILFVSPEMPPWVKSGGLADVTAALPAALRALGLDARVLAPAYGPVLEALRERVAPVATLRDLGGDYPECRLLDAGVVNGVPVFLVDCPQFYVRPGTAYQDERFVDWPDNHLRFGLLSRVAAVLGARDARLPWSADVLHCNDWPAALAPAYLYLARPPRAATVMAIHNLAHQGLFDRAHMKALGLPSRMYAIDGVEYYGQISFLKAGIFYADRLATVSPTYAREIQTDEGGLGLGGLLRVRSRDLTGILNGIDVVVWNPATDRHLARRYDVATVERKLDNKLSLQQRLGLVVEAERMLLGVVSRLADQKGIDWLLDVAPSLAEMGVQLAVLGSGDPGLEDRCRELVASHPGAIAAVIGFDEALAHRIEGSVDAFVMPSRFEPCGLNQMYSLRYGTPPIVRATGGLADTVVDCNDDTLAAHTANGFSFEASDASALLATVRRARATWRRPSLWRSLQRRGMTTDFSWSASARRYAELYADALAKRA